MEEFYLQSKGSGRIHCAIWRPKEQPKAVIQLIHGIAEHIGRYDAFANVLREQGYVVTAEDHMGHGGSIEGGTQGFFTGGWLSAVAGVRQLYDEVHAQYPELPYVMLGHSMGSFLLRTYLYTYPRTLRGAIISGTGWEAPATIKAGRLMCRLEEKRIGEKKVSKRLNDLMFGAYNKHFRPVRTDKDWICSVNSVVDAYIADPLSGFDATVGLARDMLGGIEMNEKPENLDKMDKGMPVLFISGAKDPVGGMSKGVLRCIDAFKRSGMRDVSIRIYPEGRHEMLNESNRVEVYSDILKWLDEKI